MVRRLLTSLCAGILLAGFFSAPAHAAAAGLTATYTSVDNGSWRMAKFIVSNPTTAAITGWKIDFDVPPGLTVGQGYNGTVTQTGSHVTAVNAYYNGTVAPGATTEPYSF